MNPKSGDVVKVKTNEEEIKGILMPQETDFLVVKLDNGYNIGIDRRKIKKIEVVKKYSKKEAKLKKIKSKKRVRVSILHTGGTIASKVDYETGGVKPYFTPEELVEMFPELNDIVSIKSRLIRNIASENMRFAHYNLLTKEIQKEIKKGVDGVIITHGTDTMHYSSAALSFILEDLPIPVILVGAQRSSDRGSSDAAINLISASVFIANSNFSGVAICMHESMEDNRCLILEGTKVRKMHTSRRDTFRPINTLPIAKVDFKTKKIQFLRKRYTKKDKKRKLKLKLFKENIKVGMLKIYPNMYAQEIENFKGYSGLVLEGTGLGHASIVEIDKYTKENTRIKNAIKRLKNTVVVMAPQTIYGRLQMNVYTPQRELQKLGVLGHLSDMTPETTYVKLAWLLSNYKKAEVRKLITQNLRGEITERTEEKTFLI